MMVAHWGPEVKHLLSVPQMVITREPLKSTPL